MQRLAACGRRHATTRGVTNDDARVGSARSPAGLGRESDRARRQRQERLRRRSEPEISDEIMSSARGDAEALRLAADTATRSFRQRHATTRGATNGGARYGSARALAGLGREGDRAQGSARSSCGGSKREERDMAISRLAPAPRHCCLRLAANAVARGSRATTRGVTNDDPIVGPARERVDATEVQRFRARNAGSTSLEPRCVRMGYVTTEVAVAAKKGLRSHRESERTAITLRGIGSRKQTAVTLTMEQ